MICVSKTLRTLRGRHVTWILALVVILSVGGAMKARPSLDYYAHLVLGEAHILLQREPITSIIADPSTSDTLRDSLQTVVRARKFASRVLGLPNNASYTTYVDIGRPYVIYNVYATPALSLEPIRHCFALAGCVAYRGFYDLDRAREAAATLRAAGNDVYISGVSAYSTLGYFADPVLSSMLGWNDADLIGTVFHELAHQALYVPGATAFNESFATFVSRQGLREWRQHNQLPPRNTARQQRHRQFT